VCLTCILLALLHTYKPSRLPVTTTVATRCCHAHVLVSVQSFVASSRYPAGLATVAVPCSRCATLQQMLSYYLHAWCCFEPSQVVIVPQTPATSVPPGPSLPTRARSAACPAPLDTPAQRGPTATSSALLWTFVQLAQVGVLGHGILSRAVLALPYMILYLVSHLCENGQWLQFCFESTS
jgi:hypothetical protein